MAARRQAAAPAPAAEASDGPPTAIDDIHRHARSAEHGQCLSAVRLADSDSNTDTTRIEPSSTQAQSMRGCRIGNARVRFLGLGGVTLTYR